MKSCVRTTELLMPYSATNVKKTTVSELNLRSNITKTSCRFINILAMFTMVQFVSTIPEDTLPSLLRAIRETLSILPLVIPSLLKSRRNSKSLPLTKLACLLDTRNKLMSLLPFAKPITRLPLNSTRHTSPTIKNAESSMN